MVKVFNENLTTSTNSLVEIIKTLSTNPTSIFLASIIGDPQNQIQVEQLARHLAAEHRTVVYGGEAHAGLMHVLAESAHTAGGNVVGVPYPDIIERVEYDLTNLVIHTNSLEQRLDVLTSCSKTFIACVGGPGTLQELCTVFNKYPNGGVNVYLLNVLNFWNKQQPYFTDYDESQKDKVQENFQSLFAHLAKSVTNPEHNVTFKNFKAFCQNYKDQITTADGLMEAIAASELKSASVSSLHAMFSQQHTQSTPRANVPSNTV